MINLSITQTLELWDELRDCLEGTNSYGGHTAEIYAYCLTKHHCQGTSKAPGTFDEEDEFQVAVSLTNLIQLFCSTHDCIAMIKCSGSSVPGQVRIFPQPGQGGSIPPFSHRVHVRITKRKEWLRGNSTNE